MMEDSATDTASQPKNDLGKIIDSLAKVAVISAAFLYGCGFIVVSLHQYTYGVVEIAPFRPKVLAAGVWFLGFIVVPFALVSEGVAIKFKYSSVEREEWKRKTSTYYYFLVLSCFLLGATLSLAFDASVDPMRSVLMSSTMVIVMLISGAVVFWGLWKPLPRWITTSAVLAFAGFVLFEGLRDYAHHQPSASSIGVWLLVFSFFAFSELQSRSWKLQVGNWKQSLVLAMIAITSFSTLIYPHIRPSWGGGAPTPAIIYLAKDALILPGGSVSAKILEESESGFYVIGANDKKATFIPRSQVALIYYSDDSAGPFILKSK
jgi:hypothetical protein